MQNLMTEIIFFSFGDAGVGRQNQPQEVGGSPEPEMIFVFGSLKQFREELFKLLIIACAVRGGNRWLNIECCYCSSLFR